MIRIFKKVSILIFSSFLVSACTQVEDYMLGKDNAPQPANLEPIQSKVNMVENWSVSIGKASKTRMYLKLKPVVQGNVIYTAEAGGIVEALDKHSGRILWSKDLKLGLISGPALGQGYIALGTNSSSVLLLKQSDGSEVWQQKLSGEALSKPVIADKKVIVKTIDGNLYAFNLLTGEKLWMSDHGAPHLILKASSSPVVMGNHVLVGFSDGKLDAVDLNTGNVMWQRSIAYASGASDVERLVDIDADPIVRGNVVYLATYQGYIGALSLADGQFVWHKPASTYKNLAIDDHTLYMTDSDDIVWAYNRNDGHVQWKQTGLKARGLTEPMLLGGYLLIADRTGYVHVLSRKNGEFLSRFKLSGAVDNAFAVSGNSAYIMTDNGKLSRLTVS